MENLTQLIEVLRRDHPRLHFEESERASWSPQKRLISFNPTEATGHWSVLHELGHALLGHSSYESDINLLQKEIDAWERAVKVATKYGIVIDAEHIQNCLDTYRDWLHKRSTCPTCGSLGLQQSKSLYSCLNCQGEWEVSSARFCRPYRLKKALANKNPGT